MLFRSPGIGEKSACRLTFHLLRSKANIIALADALKEVSETVRFCSTCFCITEDDPCVLCSGNRDDSMICVVEQPQDVLAIERSGAFRGRYHVLHGVLSPLSGVTPADLKVSELLERLKEEKIKEIVIATNFSVEGEATSIYLTTLLRKLGLKVTRLAHGIPIGSDLEYIDAATMQRALHGRSEI